MSIPTLQVPMETEEPLLKLRSMGAVVMAGDSALGGWGWDRSWRKLRTWGFGDFGISGLRDCGSGLL